jgi:hypothetical protein
VKNEANTLTVRKNLETKRKANSPFVGQFVQAYKDKDSAVKFEEIEIQEFKDLSKIKRENVKEPKTFDRRSINIKNPIPDQSVIVGKFFELTVDDSIVFNSNSALSLEATSIPSWLISTPLNPSPTLKSSYMPNSHFYYVWAVSLFDNYAYVAISSGLQIIDISDPSNPRFKGSYKTHFHTWGITISDNYAYLVNCCGALGHRYEPDGLLIIDISNPSNPQFKGSYKTPDGLFILAISGNYAYLASYISGLLQIVDISDPINPTFKGSYDMPSHTTIGIAISGNYAYVVNENLGLQIIDVSDPTNPKFKGSYNTPNGVRVVTISGNYAYVIGSDLDLQIIDITDPENLTFKGSCDTPDSAGMIAISGNYAYVADGYLGSGLQVIDISDPSNPIFKGAYDTPGRGGGIAISGNYAYVADHGAGLQIIALNPNKLILSGTPRSVGIYSVDIKACNEIMECVTDSFNIIVKNSLNVDLTTILGKTNSMTAVVFSVCVASFFILVVIGSRIVMHRRYRNKILRNESNTKAKELKIEKKI